MIRISGYAGLAAFLAALTFSSAAMCVDTDKATATDKGMIEREYVRSFSIDSKYQLAPQIVADEANPSSIAQAGLPGLLQVLRSTDSRAGFDYVHDTLSAGVPIYYTR